MISRRCQIVFQHFGFAHWRFGFRCRPENSSRKPKLNFCVSGVLAVPPQQRGMGELLETILWLKRSPLLRPRTGALRGGLSQPATTGNFGIRVHNRWMTRRRSAASNSSTTAFTSASMVPSDSVLGRIFLGAVLPLFRISLVSSSSSSG